MPTDPRANALHLLDLQAAFYAGLAAYLPKGTEAGDTYQRAAQALRQVIRDEAERMGPESPVGPVPGARSSGPGRWVYESTNLSGNLHESKQYLNRFLAETDIEIVHMQSDGRNTILVWRRPVAVAGNRRWTGEEAPGAHI